MTGQRPAEGREGRSGRTAAYVSISGPTGCTVGTSSRTTATRPRLGALAVEERPLELSEIFTVSTGES